jgi:hypothetical protein
MNKYKPRSRNIYHPATASGTPFRISRSKIDLFLECPRCFYLDRRLGFGRPGMPGFALNSAVDTLLKNEFDLLRKAQEPHALMVAYGIDAIPYDHPDLPVWRDDVHQFIGASTLHTPTNLEICGIIDDVWINPQEELIIADYKSTSTSKEISLEDEYKQGYKKQLEVYQWIFREMGFGVSDVGYFVYANGGKDGERFMYGEGEGPASKSGVKERANFDARLEFEMLILEHKGDTSWVEPTVREIKAYMEGEEMPESGEECEWCAYRELIGEVEQRV